MIKIKAVGGLLISAMVAIGLVAYSRQPDSGYVSSSEAVPRGKAPNMKVELLNPSEPSKQYAVIFYQGDEAFSGLVEFARKYHVTSAHFTAIGAINGATLGYFDPERKMYKKIPSTANTRLSG